MQMTPFEFAISVAYARGHNAGIGTDIAGMVNPYSSAASSERKAWDAGFRLAISGVGLRVRLPEPVAETKRRA